jgi:hypothetical protein
MSPSGTLGIGVPTLVTMRVVVITPLMVTPRLAFESCNTLILEEFKTCQVNAFHLNSSRKFSNNLIVCISWHAYFYF